MQRRAAARILMSGLRPPSARASALLVVVHMCSGGLSACSVLTHEEIVDLVWPDKVQPLLLARYPGLSEDQIREAHAYAYGGAVIQDLGYYPFGSKEFSNLLHYVRSGDFVRELLLESQMLTNTPLRWAHCRTMCRTSPAIPRSTRPLRSSIRSCEPSLASQSGTPGTRRRT